MDLEPVAEMQKVIHIEDTQPKVPHESIEVMADDDIILTGKPYDQPKKPETTPPAAPVVTNDSPSARMKKYLQEVGGLSGCGWNS